MSSFNIQLPTITESALNSPKERKAILEALYQVNEQLRYVLNNLGEENLSDELKTKIETAGNNEEFTRRLGELSDDSYSFFKQTKENFQLVVYKNGVISSINLSPEGIAIKASKIALEGYVSINGKFSVDTDGNMHATGGSIGGWSINNGTIISQAGGMSLDGVNGILNSGTIYGSVINAATMFASTLNSATINSATINTATLNSAVINGTSIYGGSIYGSSGIYMGYENGVIDLYAPALTPSTVQTPSVTSPTGNLRLTNGSYTLSIGYGDMGGYPFNMNSSLGVSGVVDCTEVISGSDSRLKKEIAEIDENAAADTILNLRPVTFKYRTGDGRTHNGFLAQEAPESMRRIGKDGYLALAYNEVIAPLVKTVQSQEKRIQALEERLANLEVR